MKGRSLVAWLCAAILSASAAPIFAATPRSGGRTEGANVQADGPEVQAEWPGVKTLGAGIQAEGLGVKTEATELEQVPATVQLPGPVGRHRLPWWAWTALLFVTTVIIGIVAVLGGVGGGVLFIPIVGTFFPFHSDFVRCTGLLIALAGSLSAGPILIRKNLANLRLSIPAALIASATSIFGAKMGLALPSNVVQMATASLMTGIIILLAVSKNPAFPDISATDAVGKFLGFGGAFTDEASGREVRWNIHRTLPGLVIFSVVGFMAGMFGLGAGWANVPVLNLFMGAPLKIAVATSNLIIATSSSTAAWVYINEGALIPAIAIPAMIGMMAGTRIGARLLSRVDSGIVRIAVLALLGVATLLSFLKGFGVLR